MPQDGPLSDGDFLAATGELLGFYQSFTWESQIWTSYGARRSPYRVLILFGLSPRTKDQLLVRMCRRFFDEFPCLVSLEAGWPEKAEAVRAIVRQGQAPFIDATADAIRKRGEEVLKDAEGLMSIRGVGQKVVECVMGYGWGREALPLDGNAARVIGRLFGLEAERGGRQSAYIRGQLKRIFNCHREWMADRAIAMIDTHELFRLHGQLVCGRAPRCSRCPVSRCRSRKQKFTASAEPTVTPSLWQDWRELLLDPDPSGASY